MRSSSSRNLAHHHHHHLANNQQSNHHANSRSQTPHERFIVMQMLQAILFTTRTSFLMYDLIHAIVHKVIIYDRIGQMFGESATASEKLYSISVGLIAIFMISMIIFTFVYNYMLVHENLYGILAMAVFLVFILVYNLVTFGQYSTMESMVICGASATEITALLYLLTLIKHKKQVRYVQKFEKRFSIISNSNKNNAGGKGHHSPLGTSTPNRQLPHQRKFANKSSGLTSPTPPSITISFTDGDGNDEHEQIPDESIDSEQRYDDDEDTERTEKLENKKIEEEEEEEDDANKNDNAARSRFDEHRRHEDKYGSSLSVGSHQSLQPTTVSNSSTTGHRQRKHQRHSSSKGDIQNDSESSVNESRHDRAQHSHSKPERGKHSDRHQRKQNRLTVPNVQGNDDNEKEEKDEKRKMITVHKDPNQRHQRQNVPTNRTSRHCIMEHDRDQYNSSNAESDSVSVRSYSNRLDDHQVYYHHHQQQHYHHSGHHDMAQQQSRRSNESDVQSHHHQHQHHYQHQEIRQHHYQDKYYE